MCIPSLLNENGDEKRGAQHLPLLNSREKGQSLCQDSVPFFYKGPDSECCRCGARTVPASAIRCSRRLMKAASLGVHE